MDPPDTAAKQLHEQHNSKLDRPASPGLTTPAKATAVSAAADGSGSGNGTPGATKLTLDMSVGAAVSALVHHLVHPLAVHYSHTQLMGLRTELTAGLTKRFTPSWNESNQHAGSGARSLIADKVLGLPPVLQDAARAKDIDTAVWTRAIASTRRKRADADDSDEWEVWCDPGMVVWRWGGWGWDEVEFDPVKRHRESYTVIWQAAPTPVPADEATSPVASTTPARSRAIPIRAPALLNIPATPSPASSGLASAARSPSPSLLPAAEISALGGYRSHNRVNSTAESESAVRPGHSRTGSRANTTHTRGHKGQGSTSSNASDSSDNGSTQPLTPASRPGSADLFPEDAVARKAAAATPDDGGVQRGRDMSPASAARSEPTVTPYDGGNVTVLGGGTKLGGSRPSSVLANHRTRSPSVSIASRALGNAVGPNSNGATPPGTPRKPRTRRRIIPTHIGYFGQPGVGAPMMGAFGGGAVKSPVGGSQAPNHYWPHSQPGSVGVGLAPPPVGAGVPQMGMHAMPKRVA